MSGLFVTDLSALSHVWRRPVPFFDLFISSSNVRYADLEASDIPVSESLFDCMERAVPIWESKIKQQLKRGRNVLVGELVRIVL